MPVATDIAFALGVLGAGRFGAARHPRVFLLGIAVADDPGAIAVIAVVCVRD